MKRTIYLITLVLICSAMANAQTITNPRAMAEWEEVQAVVISAVGYEYHSEMTEMEIEFYNARRRTMTAIAREAAKEGIKVFIEETEDKKFKEYFISQGIPAEQLISIIYDENSHYISTWLRDIGPATVYENEVDSLYFAAWAGDNGAKLLANFLNVSFLEDNYPYSSGIYLDGGNFLTDGHGRLFADSDCLYDNNNDFNNIKTSYQNNMGINEIFNLPSYMVHIDYYLKLIDEETFFVADIPQSNYNTSMDSEFDDNEKIQAAIDYIKQNYVSCYGRPYKFVRITNAPTIYRSSDLNLELTTKELSYTNSLILNKTVLVPTYDTLYWGKTEGIEEFDKQALETYERLMPGYRIVGIPTSVYGGGSVHCLTREIGVAEPVFISHAWLPDTVYSNSNDYEFKAVIKTRSDIKNATLKWAVEPGLNYASVTMTIGEQDTFIAVIPQQINGTKVHYYIQAESNSGKTNKKPMVAPGGTFEFLALDKNLGILDDNNTAIQSYSLSQNYPNPFNPTTTISYSLPEAAQVKLTVYNSLGQKVRTLVDARVVAGSHSAIWNGLNDESMEMVSGIYIYRFEAGDYLKVQKMLLLR